MVVLHPLPLLQLRGGLIPTMSEGAIDSPITTAALFIGTFSSAISGCISAGTKEMDLIGCIVVALVTALGGGTMRDILLGRAVYWRYAPNRIHLHIVIYTSACTFLVWPAIVARGFKDTHLAFLWSDALAMAASTVIGTHIGLKATNNWLIGVLSGLCTATFGGIGRDLLCQEPPRALYAERSMYATPAVVGAVAYTLLQLGHADLLFPDWVLLVVPFALTLSLRAAAWTYRLALPHWARKRPSVFSFSSSKDVFEIKIKNDKIGEPEVATPKQLLQKVKKVKFLQCVRKQLLGPGPKQLAEPIMAA